MRNVFTALGPKPSFFAQRSAKKGKNAQKPAPVPASGAARSQTLAGAQNIQRSHDTRLPSHLICDILLHEDAKLLLPTLRRVAAGNASLQSDLYRDKNLERFATAEELRYAQERKTWFLRQQPDATERMPAFLLLPLFRRWDQKSQEQLDDLQALEQHLRQQYDTNGERATGGVFDEKLNRIVVSAVDKKLKRGAKVDIDFALTLYWLGGSAARGLHISSVSSDLFSEPNIMLAVANHCPQSIRFMSWKLINEDNLYRVPGWFYSSSNVASADHRGDDGAFEFTGFFEKVVEQAVKTNASDVRKHIPLLLARVQQRQLQVRDFARNNDMTTKEAARYLDRIHQSDKELSAKRAMTIDLPAMRRYIGFEDGHQLPPIRPDSYAAVESDDSDDDGFIAFTA